MTGEYHVKPNCIFGKVSQMNGVSATIILENGQKILWPAKKINKCRTVGQKIKIYIQDCSNDSVEEDRSAPEEGALDAKIFLNSLLDENREITIFPWALKK